MLRIHRARKRTGESAPLLSNRYRDMLRIPNSGLEISGGLSPKFIEVFMAFCESCGTQAGADDRFCKACGKPISSVEPNAQTAAADSQNIPAEPSTPHAPTIVIPVHPMAPVTPVSPAPATVFCRACGKQSPAAYEFCESCGASLRGNVSTAQAPVQPPAPSPQYAQPPSAIPPQRKSHLGVWLGVIFGALAIIVIVLLVALLSGPKPEDSLDQLRTAYLQHDQASFDKYVDVNSVLNDWTDQGVNEWLKQQNAGALETATVQVVAGAVKSAYIPDLSKSVDQMVVSGTLPDQSQNSDDKTTAFITGFVSSVVRNIAASQLTYQGVQSKAITNDNAELTVGVTSSVSSQPISVHIKMRRDGDHWRVVAVENLAGLLNQLNPTPTP
jgi:hypothetical protein